MSLSFDATFYQSQRPDVYNAFVATAGSTGLTWAQFAQNHYDTFGRFEGSDPSASFSTSFYLSTYPDVAAAGVNPFDHFLANGSAEGRQPFSTFPTSSFVEATYLAANPDVQAAVTAGTFANGYQHWVLNGQFEGRPGAPTVTTPGNSESLTVNTDNIIGTSGDDTIDGSAFFTNGAFTQTLNNADSIDGGAGTDTMNVQMRNAGTTTVNSLSNVEVINVEAQAGGGTISLLNSDASVTTVGFNNSAVNAAVTNIGSALTTLNVSNPTAGTTHTVTSRTGLTGTSDALAVNLTGVAAGSGLITAGPTAAGSGYETFNIASNGPLTNAVNITDGAGTSLATINVTGSAGFTTTLQDTTVTTFDASAATGAINLTSIAGSGAQAITGGTGNDTINMAGTYTTADTLNGGDGTDNLGLTNAEAVAATTAQTNVTNFENINLTTGLNGTITVPNFSVNSLTFGAAMAGAGTLNYNAGTDNALNVANFGSGNFALTVNVAGTATTDAVALTVGSAAAGNAWGTGNVTFNGAETVNLLSQGGANTFGGTFTLTQTAANQNLVITGSQNLTFTGAVGADSIDASAFTGILALNGGTGAVATSITGGTGNDILIGSTVGDIINGGAGNDTITNALTGTAASAADQITTGDGTDTVILHGDTASGAVATILNATSFISDFTVGATVAASDYLGLSATAGNYANVDAFYAGVAVGAAGSAGLAIQSIAQNAPAAGVAATTDILKLTTGVATAGTLQAAFNTAIGTATVTGFTAGDDIFFTLYDTTNSRMLVGTVDSTNGTNTQVETGDTVSLVGSISMSATDYAAFSTNNFTITA